MDLHREAPPDMIPDRDFSRAGLAVLAVVAAFFAGYLVNDPQWSRGSGSDRATLSQAAGAYAHHGTVDLSNSSTIPQVDLVVHKDPVAGSNLEVITQNFRFAPERAGSEHIAGEGHAHLYVDGRKVARLYGRWFHLADLAPGTHTVRVTLNANSHRELAIGGEVIEDVEVITVAER